MTRPLQEDPERKQAWLQNATKLFPVGTRVRVCDSDVDEYVDATGIVTGYDLGLDGDWPLICVNLTYARKAMFSRTGNEQDSDGFYDDELEIIT